MPYDDRLPVLKFDGLEIIYTSTLKEVIEILEGKVSSFFTPKREEVDSDNSSFIDFQQIIGHIETKKALEIAAAGEHHVLMTGPPGCGKSMLAESFPSILPPLSKEAQLEVLALHQLSGTNYPNANNPPFRSPHHSASGIAIIGGGTYPKPGEISLSHRGVLFLDEIAEFPKKTLDMLRQPFENGKITISRTHATLTYPASFILIAAMNPCPCGYAGSNTHYCTCTPKQKIAYQNKISGPLRDRFDIHLAINPVDLEGKIEDREFSSKFVQKRVKIARNLQHQRYGKQLSNSRVSFDTLQKTSPLTDGQQRLIRLLATKKNWSTRTQIKIIRLARTISDLEGENHITEQSIWEAVKLRNGEW